MPRHSRRRQLSVARSALFRSFEMINRPGFRIYLVLPGVVSLLQLVLLVWGGWEAARTVNHWLAGWFGTAADNGLLQILVRVMILLFSLLLYFLVYKSVALIVLSPVLAQLSEKAETRLAGTPPPPFSPVRIMREAWRGVRISVRAFVREMGLTLLFILAGFIPVVGVLSPAAIIVIQSYFIGFALMDYYNERKGRDIPESVRFVGDNRYFAFGIGFSFLLLFWVPVIGLVLAPPVCTVAASIGSVELDGPVAPPYTAEAP